MAPVVLAMEKEKHQIQSLCVVTAQHREMLDQVLKLFGIKPYRDLNIMEERQTLARITTRAMAGLDSILEEEKPDLVLVQGDTTTAFIAALAAFYHKIPVGHVEAGLRTDNKYSPFPEEINRRLISVIGDLNFAPTPAARANLLKNGVARGSIFLTGNTVTDALLHILKTDKRAPRRDHKRKILLVETHRRENLGKPLQEICEALKKLVLNFTDVEILFSVHKNPQVRKVVFSTLKGVERVNLVEPMDYPDLVKAMKESYLILTDSGGIQEEAPSLGKPVLVLRETTERPEGIKAGTAKLVGTQKEKIFKDTAALIENKKIYDKMSHAVNPYGDGRASSRILQAILYYLGKADKKPDEFNPAGK